MSDRYPNVRIDTHKDNVPMRNLLKKMGFTHCGVIRLLDKDESPREAYMKVSSL
jgi:RimJ/RimL family protein N-acetyltransferase